MKLKHPTTDHKVEVEPDHAEPFVSQGWVEVKSTAKPKPDDK